MLSTGHKPSQRAEPEPAVIILHQGPINLHLCGDTNQPAAERSLGQNRSRHSLVLSQRQDAPTGCQKSRHRIPPPRMYSGLVEGRQPFKAIKTTQPTELRGAEARPFASAPPVHSVKARLLNVASGALLQQTRGHRGRYAVSPLSVRT